MSNIISISVELNNAKHFSEKVKERALAENKNILLDYPVVYVHTWIDDKGENKVYIGETNNILRRTEEHQKSEEEKTWQSDWKKGTNLVSWIFGSNCMNKSMVLDLENELIGLTKSVESVALQNGRGNEQGDYSNKGERDLLLNEIWETLCEKSFKIDYTPIQGKAKHQQQDDKLHILSSAEITNDDKTIVINADNDPLIYSYPVVYMHIWVDNGRLHTYTGESNSVNTRTQQHKKETDITAFLSELSNNKTADTGLEKWHNRWQKAQNKIMLVFGHKEMNKSITLDIENLLIYYTTFLGLSENGRGNIQRSYNNRDNMYQIFQSIVKFLNEKVTPELPNLLGTTVKNAFKSLDEVKNDSVFCASSLVALSDEQKKAKDEIKEKIIEKLNKTQNDTKEVLIVSGSAGTGKTVLISSLLFDLIEEKKSAHLIVNHDELFVSYNLQSNARSTATNDLYHISKADDFIKNYNADIVLIDEAHLLFSQKHMNSIKDIQLTEIVKKSKVAVLMLDVAQFLKSHTMLTNTPLTEDGIEDAYQQLFDNIKPQVKVNVTKITELKQQFRMNCSEETISWIKSIPSNDRIKPFPYDKHCPKKYTYDDKNDIPTVTEYNENGDKVYEIAVFTSPEVMTKVIEYKKRSDNPCALIASYCWKDGDEPIDVGENWNYKWCWHKTGSKKSEIWTLKSSMRQKNTNMFEVGSFHDIQGFDLNYAGVILGKSLEIIKRGQDKGKVRLNAKKRRALSENTEGWKDMIINEIDMLLTRGRKGLYIYACDKELREALIEAMKQKQ